MSLQGREESLTVWGQYRIADRQMNRGDKNPISISRVKMLERDKNKKFSWCWEIRATRLDVSQGHQTWYHSICQVWFPRVTLPLRRTVFEILDL